MPRKQLATTLMLKLWASSNSWLFFLFSGILLQNP